MCKIHLQIKLLKDMGSNLHIPQILGMNKLFQHLINRTNGFGWLGYAQERNGWLQHKITLNYANDNNHIRFKDLEEKKLPHMGAQERIKTAEPTPSLSATIFSIEWSP